MPTGSVQDLFDSDREKGIFSCCYRNFVAPLSDGTLLRGCTSNYVVVERLGVAYFELFLDVRDILRCSALISSLLPTFLKNPQFLLPEAMQNNTVRIRQNDQDVFVKYNQLPVMPALHIFTTARLALDLKTRLVADWERYDIQLYIYDLNYAEANARKVKPFAFISHDSRDKQDVARPLAERLRQEVGTIWYDEYSLRVGDSLRESIESGLKTSDRCILLLSRHYFENGGWAKREFDSIYTRELVERQNVILPVWVDVDRDEVYQYCPILVDRLASLWSKGIDTVVEELASVLKQSSDQGS